MNGTLTPQARAMIRSWVAMHHGNHEHLAKWMRRRLGLKPIQACRDMIRASLAEKETTK